MIKHLNEYDRMKNMQNEIENLQARSEEFTRKIELARTLPGTILQTATLPVEGLTVEMESRLLMGCRFLTVPTVNCSNYVLILLSIIRVAYRLF